MASLKPTLTLTGTQVDLGSTLSLTVGPDDLSVVTPMIGISKIVAPDNSPGTLTNIFTAAATDPEGAAVFNTYCYVKHTGNEDDGVTATTNILRVDIGGTDCLRLKAEEFAFFPVKVGLVVGIVSTGTTTIEVEYAYWTGD